VTTEFDTDLKGTLERVKSARQRLLDVLGGLTDADLAAARRGGWTVAKVLEHVIGGEWHYAVGVHRLREREPLSPPQVSAVGSLAEAREQLGSARQALLEAVDGVTEDEFYAVRQLGREEYSVLSLLENVELHDNEHSAQIEQIRAATA
jgi:hypothetical protein